MSNQMRLCSVYFIKYFAMRLFHFSRRCILSVSSDVFYNGKEYVILFFEPKHIAANTTIYDSKFHSLHLFLVWAVSQMSREDHKYDNNFIFLTTSDFIFDKTIDEDSSLNGFHTNEGTDIYIGLCRKNRPFQCKKITNPKVPDPIFKNK